MPESPYRYLTPSVEQGVLVLTLTTSELQDEKVTGALHQEFMAAVEHYRPRKVVVDLHQLRYVSSVAFRPLLSLRKKMLENGGRLMLCGLSSVVGDVFYTTRMVGSTGNFSAPFELEADVAAAVARLNSDQAPQQA
jgi:anti-anti-sigma factor